MVSYTRPFHSTTHAYKLQSGVAVASPTDLDEALDEWIEIIEHRNEERKGQEANDIKREKAESEMKKENLPHPAPSIVQSHRGNWRLVL